MIQSTSRTGVNVRRAASRFTTDAGWLDSKYSFSFANHDSRTNTHHGLLLVNNDDIVPSGTGFETHLHRDIEIVTWVVQGSLVHQDSMGHHGVIYPGLAQGMSAGTGILHSEKNDSWGLGSEVLVWEMHATMAQKVGRPTRSDVGEVGERSQEDYECHCEGQRREEPIRDLR
jgi:redox-sensitive bicupin YhaK (pirin superfamily)